MYLTSRRYAHQKAAARNKQLLGEQNRKRPPNGAADDSTSNTTSSKLVEGGMIAGPVRVRGGALLPQQVGDNIAIRVQEAN